MLALMSGVAKLRYSSAVKIVCDGNSLTHSYNTGTPYPQQLAALAPLSAAVTVVNRGISGQSTSQMTSDATDVEGHYDAAKTNLLVVLEGTNSLQSNSAAVAAEHMRLYIAARLAAQPTRMILLITCPPRQLVSSTEAADITFNTTKIDAYNEILRANWRAWGVKVLVDIRVPGSPFNLPGYTRADFNASQATDGIWAAAEVNAYTHLSTAGYAALAAMVAAGLRRMPAR